VENTAGATTTFDDDGDPATDPLEVTDSDDAVVETSPNPGLSLEKTADPNTFTKAGDMITYSYTLTNTGNVTLYQPYYVTDDHIPTVNCPSTPQSLAPGESVTCSAVYFITADDVSRGSVTNAATAFAPWIAGCTLNTCVEIANSGEASARITRSGSNGEGDGEDNQVAAQALHLPATGFAPGKVTLLDMNEMSATTATEMRLEIPGLGVDIPISGVPFKDGGWNVKWLWNQAGWLEGTAFPTSSGNSVITSHVYLPSGKPGPFVGITNLRWGDQILIRNGSLTYTYEVRSVKRVKPESVALVMKHETLSWLTLLTCQGYNVEEDSYDYRVAVRAVLVEIK
jgi:LPXTG-site transpeptidase (sortase) family protein